MAITTFMAVPKGIPGKDTFICDATVSVNVSYENDITTHPVDTRSNISSHAYNMNPVIKVNGVVTGSYSPEDYVNNPSLQPDPDNNIIGYNTDRVQQALTLLKQLWKDRNAFTIVSANDVYENCILKSLNFTIDKFTSSDLVFEITVEQVRFATTEKIRITQLDPFIQADAEGNKAGRKTKLSADTDLTFVDALGSSAAEISDFLKNLLGGGNG